MRQKQMDYEAKRAEYLKRCELAGTSPAQRTAKRSQDADAMSEVSVGSSVSTAATLALSLEEEKEARKMERKLRDIERLQCRQAGGEVLDKLQLEKINSKSLLEAHVVMVKVRANAVRPELVR